MLRDLLHRGQVIAAEVLGAGSNAGGRVRAGAGSGDEVRAGAVAWTFSHSVRGKKKFMSVLYRREASKCRDSSFHSQS